ncbi:hypothetical protein ACWZHB_01415 [Nocardia sp. FBN12]|uniref:hypothetical protein n=1 Tax=Nocardia sp. FBN12 TaxID=3419766 RepID=UPI003CFF480C
MPDQKRHWSDLSPQEAAEVVLPQPGILDCLDDMGDPCPWPWWPTHRQDIPGGMAHCPHCGSMVVRGLPHPDFTFMYRPEDAPPMPDASTESDPLADIEWINGGGHARPA